MSLKGSLRLSAGPGAANGAGQPLTRALRPRADLGGVCVAAVQLHQIDHLLLGHRGTLQRVSPVPLPAMRSTASTGSKSCILPLVLEVSDRAQVEAIAVVDSLEGIAGEGGCVEQCDRRG